jgi:hypothetical protein
VIGSSDEELNGIHNLDTHAVSGLARRERVKPVNPEPLSYATKGNSYVAKTVIPCKAVCQSSFNQAARRCCSNDDTVKEGPKLGSCTFFGFPFQIGLAPAALTGFIEAATCAWRVGSRCDAP